MAVTIVRNGLPPNHIWRMIFSPLETKKEMEKCLLLRELEQKFRRLLRHSSDWSTYKWSECIHNLDDLGKVKVSGL